MKTSHSIFTANVSRQRISVLKGAALLAAAGVAALSAGGASVTDPVGFIAVTATGGTVATPGLTFVSPSLVNPVEWQGPVTSAEGQLLEVSDAAWAAGQFDSRYYVEIASGAYAGVWTDIIASDAGELTTNDPLGDLLNGGETIKIRRFTTLSDLFGANNEAGLLAGVTIARADVIRVYHAAGDEGYWYYNGSQGGEAGWYDSSWNPAADAVIAPGEGVILQRRSAEALPLYFTGAVKTGPLSIVVEKARSFIGGVTPVDITLENSQLYTGSATGGFVGGVSLARADRLLVYGNGPGVVYWYYDGSQGGNAGWYDDSWNPSDDAVIPGGATFAIERTQGDAFQWFLPALLQ